MDRIHFFQVFFLYFGITILKSIWCCHSPELCKSGYWYVHELQHSKQKEKGVCKLTRSKIILRCMRECKIQEMGKRI
ncbi:hypothetical protein BDQ17DRAFT_468096 [Cyathus striatus]|nr:hypothetical protein BDQ17DRAFT_1100765 [Cyathus striatus]KAF9003965.1 hypothetical protein BDQ17DRAFT_468096 [Cyathus striatus]